jgi:hypothetical protein
MEGAPPPGPETRTLSQWSERLRGDRAAQDDFLAWVGRREMELVARVFSSEALDLEALAQARGAKKVLDELRRCATMQDREELANARYRAGVEPSE